MAFNTAFPISAIYDFPELFQFRVQQYRLSAKTSNNVIRTSAIRAKVEARENSNRTESSPRGSNIQVRLLTWKLEIFSSRWRNSEFLSDRKLRRIPSYKQIRRLHATNPHDSINRTFIRMDIHAANENLKFGMLRLNYAFVSETVSQNSFSRLVLKVNMTPRMLRHCGQQDCNIAFLRSLRES